MPVHGSSEMIATKSRPVRASAIGHVGEILQGAAQSGSCLHRFLVSLPAPEFRASATFRPSSKGGLRVSPVWKQKGLRAANLAFHAFGSPDTSGLVRLSSNIPVCRGLGSSTSDCVAAIHAAAAWCQADPSAETVAKLAQQAEGSSDSTMFGEQVVAFRHCEGTVHEYLGKGLPLLRALLVESVPASRGVRTDRLQRPDYTATQIDCFAQLLSKLKETIQAGDARGIGAVATASATINQQYFPKPHFGPVIQVAEQSGALGVAAAHSGTLLVLLYAAEGDSGARISEARARLAGHGLSANQDLLTGL